MDCRLINENTLPQVAELWDYCFEKKDTEFYKWYFHDYCLKQNKILGGFTQEGQLATMLHLNPYLIKIGQKELKLPYIVGVATAPEARGQHAMGALLDTTFSLLRASKTPLVILKPIAAEIYRPYGFAYTCYRQHYHLPIAKVPAMPSLISEAHSKLRRAVPSDVKEELAKIYVEAMSSKSGCVQRSELNWDNLLAVAMMDNTECVLAYASDGIPVGYCLYTQSGAAITTNELIALTPGAKGDLLRYLAGFADKKELDWLAADDDLTYLHYRYQEPICQKEAFMMGRVLNTAQVFRDLPLHEDVPDGSFVIFVEDKSFPINHFYTRVIIKQGVLSLQDTTDDPDVVLDVGTMAQLVFGTFTVSELAANGQIDIVSGMAEAMLAKLFPWQNNYINEYF